MQKDQIDPKEKVCYNCKHLAWMIAIGQGLRCAHPKKDQKFSFVPSRRHTCEMFTEKEPKSQDEYKK